MISTDEQKIQELLTRGVEEIFVKSNLYEALTSGKQLRIKLGIDPTGPKIHIGRAVTLRKLRAFQDLGHQIVLIVGDFTATIGDASDKDGKRPMLSREQVEKNFQDYKNQIGKILDVSKVEFRYNSEWLGKLDAHDMGVLMDLFSIQQMLRRRNFAERFERGDEISLREFIYPLLQGYDSVAIQADVEIGGFDQLFNLQSGRILQKAHDMPEQNIMTLQMLEGTDGRKMSTSWGNIITIVDDPDEMFGKIMSVRDDLLEKYFLLATDISQEEITTMKDAITAGANPMEYKKRLGREVVTLYHDAPTAEAAQKNWEKTFSEGGVPEHLPEINATSQDELINLLVDKKIVESKSEVRRLITEGAIKIMREDDEEKLSDSKQTFTETVVLKIGKKKFVKIII